MTPSRRPIDHHFFPTQKNLPEITPVVITCPFKPACEICGLGLEHIRQYQAHLFTDRKLEAVSVAQQLSALRFLFLKILKRPWQADDMPVPKRPIRLPEVLSREEVERSQSNPLPARCIESGCLSSMPPAFVAKN